VKSNAFHEQEKRQYISQAPYRAVRNMITRTNDALFYIAEV
jgi:hypothetical protein